jgi:hypothetical protein
VIYARTQPPSNRPIRLPLGVLYCITFPGFLVNKRIRDGKTSYFQAAPSWFCESLANVVIYAPQLHPKSLNAASALHNIHPPCPSGFKSLHFHSNPFLASSTFLAASPALKPPFETQIAFPSPNSNFSSKVGCGHGQWCGKCTHARVSGQR